jgi:anti-anti-sigma factor
LQTETRTIANKQYAFVPLSGCLDQETLPCFTEKIEALIDGDHAYLVFDLGELDFISSHAVGYLQMLHKKLEVAEKRMAFINANAEIQDTLEFIGLAKLVAMFDAEEKFLEAMRNEEI